MLHVPGSSAPWEGGSTGRDTYSAVPCFGPQSTSNSTFGSSFFTRIFSALV